ncbi:NADH dehydrogenase [ubiquinone] 1 alpha subcomplex assembly factor 3 [Diplodia seriata]|uniref:NADH dehydrogenase [ubiquinone] 1 alpha subcomplex assembly factor 3 n=1 Tax=Diplodia seriata TaxID=420778 RepID=A0A1S8BGW5_9PEZI|nr:NADH dehydrogenase [ubiquinone] 1 alpha subcomplex assembly factor 3 [Diplodia seriata]
MPPPSTTPATTRALLRALTPRTAPSAASSSSRPVLLSPRRRCSPISSAASTIHNTSSRRNLSSTPHRSRSNPPVSRDRGPPSHESTQTDFERLDVLANMPAPTTAVDATFDDGFALNSGLHVTNMAGVLLVAGDAFAWRPWVKKDSHAHGSAATTATTTVGGGEKAGEKGKKEKETLRNERGMWECDRAAWGALELVWPKPDLLIIGTGATVVPVSPTTRKHVNDLGIRLEVSDTRNAAAQFNLLATERGVQQVAAALVPIGWREEVGGR